MDKMSDELGIESMKPVKPELSLGVEKLKPSAKKSLSIRDKIHIKRVEGFSKEEKDSAKKVILSIWQAFGYLLGLILTYVIFPLIEMTGELLNWDKELEKERLEKRKKKKKMKVGN